MCHHLMQYWIPDNTGLRYCNFQSPRNQTPYRLKTSAFLNLPATLARGCSMAEDENAHGERVTCYRGGCQGSSQRLACVSCSLGVGSAGLPHWTHAIKPQTSSNCDWSEETVEVSASVTFPTQISSSIFVGILHQATSLGGFTPSRHRLTPTRSSPEAGPQDLSLLWSYDHVSLCCFGNPRAFLVVLFPYSDHIVLSLWLCLCYLTVDLFVCSPLLSCSKHPCLLPRGTDCQELDSKDFLTDPAVYCAISKFQKF